jgi:ferric-dicitrate binding protein FerR (iron transport regulator)
VQRVRGKRLVMGVLLLVLALGAGYWLWPAQRGLQAQYATQAGQQRTVRLPDGSVVVLNGNSRLTTAATWDAQTPREVWLEGEGYFQVSHLAQQPGLAIEQAAGNAKFVVHAGDLSVSVLGTKFNVINRLGVPSKVTLNDGKVLAEHGNLFSHNEVLMKPGDLVEYAPAAQELAKRTVEPTYYSAWVTGTVKFDHTPLSEIIQLLKDSYGLQVTVDDPRMPWPSRWECAASAPANRSAFGPFNYAF